MTRPTPATSPRTCRSRSAGAATRAISRRTRSIAGRAKSRPKTRRLGEPITASSPIQAPAWRFGTIATAAIEARATRSPTHHGIERAIPAPARIQVGSFARPSWASQSNQTWTPEDRQRHQGQAGDGRRPDHGGPPVPAQEVEPGLDLGRLERPDRGRQHAVLSCPRRPGRRARPGRARAAGSRAGPRPVAGRRHRKATNAAKTTTWTLPPRRPSVNGGQMNRSGIASQGIARRRQANTVAPR